MAIESPLQAEPTHVDPVSEAPFYIPATQTVTRPRRSGNPYGRSPHRTFGNNFVSAQATGTFSVLFASTPNEPRRGEP